MAADHADGSTSGAPARRVRWGLAVGAGGLLLATVLGDDSGSRLYWSLVDPGRVESADCSFHDYEGTGRNPEERLRLLADLGHRHILVLRNHGLLIVGTSIAAAFVAVYRMERACAMQLAFQQSGAASHPITDEVVSAASNRPTGGRNEPAKFEWPALLRKLDRIDPSYKQ